MTELTPGLAGVAEERGCTMLSLMSHHRRLDGAIALFGKNDLPGAGRVLSELFDDLQGEPPPARGAALEALSDRLAAAHPELGAQLATLGGAIVEMGGVSAGPFARALAVPVRAVLASARRFLESVAAAPADDSDDAADLGVNRISARDLLAIEARDPHAVASFQSLETWYRPVVAAWSRDVDALREAQSDAALRGDVLALGGVSEGTAWLSMLLNTLVDAPLVLLVPELHEAYSITATGVVDCGQLSVLLSDALPELMARIGCPAVAPADVLAVMRGEGEPQAESAFTAAFHLYGWRALCPAAAPSGGDPCDWLAPGCARAHSLPPDFMPGKIEPLQGARVFALAGPAAPGGIRYVRSIGATRMFDALRADLKGPRRLPAAEAGTWLEAVRAALPG